MYNLKLPPLIFALILFGILHFYLAINYCDVNWITAYGAFLVVSGIISGLRSLIRFGFKKIYENTKNTDLNIVDPGEKIDLRFSLLISPILLIIGTVLNGYGAIFWKIFYFHCSI
jgi:hypothetical protein